MSVVTEPAAIAAEAIRLIRADTGLAESLAEQALAAALAADDAKAASMAERALGLAARERNDMAASVTHRADPVRDPLSANGDLRLRRKPVRQRPDAV